MPGDATVPAAQLDLLQQHYAPRARLAALKRAYIPAAALLAAWLFATLALDAIEWARLSRVASAAEEEMRALLLKSFSGNPRDPDPAEQMRRGLGSRHGQRHRRARGHAFLRRARRRRSSANRRARAGHRIFRASLIIRVAASEADARVPRAHSCARDRSTSEVQRVGGEARLRAARGRGREKS